MLNWVILFLLSAYSILAGASESHTDFEPGTPFETAKVGKIDVNFALINDNTYGLFELFSGRKLADDFGDTHGILVEINNKNEIDVNYKFIYFSNVYTRRESERYYTEDEGRTYDQFFTEENLVKIMIDNKDQRKDFFYEVGFGVVELNKDDVGNWLNAAGQQRGLHDSIGLFHPNNIPRHNQNQQGALIDLGIGKQAIYISKDRSFKVIGEVKINTIANTIKDASSISMSSSANYYYQKNKNSFAYKVGTKLTSTFHQTDNEPMNNLALSFGVGKSDYSFELIINKIIAGHKQNYQDFNYDREATFTLQFSGKFDIQNR